MRYGVQIVVLAFALWLTIDVFEDGGGPGLIATKLVAIIAGTSLALWELARERRRLGHGQ